MIRQATQCGTVYALIGFFVVSNANANDVIESAGLFTVKITTAVDYPFGDEKKGTWRGSGFLVDRERGWILTNAHVAGKSPSIVRVSFRDKPFSSAEKLYIDNQLDLAVLKVDASKIPNEAITAELKCHGEPSAGLPVIAFGHPWGLDYTATRGIISGTKARDGEEKLQTDAALNPGNSGGPLLDAQSGIVVGINSSGLSKTVSEGLNFAVPAQHACVILDLLRNGKDPSPPILPITFATTSKERELVVAESNGDWAELLKPGDRILSVNGDEAARFSSRFVSYLRAGEPIRVGILRNAKKEFVNLPVLKDRDHVHRLGVHVSGMVIGRSTITGYDPNVMWVQFLDDASVAEQAQFRDGDQVLSINGVTVKSHDDVFNALSSRVGTEVEIIVRHPRFSLISGRYDYFARTLEVRDLFVVNEKGKVK
jgi:serine protease Do